MNKSMFLKVTATKNEFNSDQFHTCFSYQTEDVLSAY